MQTHLILYELSNINLHEISALNYGMLIVVTTSVETQHEIVHLDVCLKMAVHIKVLLPAAPAQSATPGTSVFIVWPSVIHHVSIISSKSG